MIINGSTSFTRCELSMMNERDRVDINIYNRDINNHTIDDRCLEWPLGAYPISDGLVARKFGPPKVCAEDAGRRR